MPQEFTTSSRRQFARTPTKGHVFVHCRGRFQRAKIANYSQVGLQLEGTFGLIKRDVVLIELISGVRVEGKVEWSLGGQTGIAFSELLATSHPAMVELARKATWADHGAVAIAGVHARLGQVQLEAALSELAKLVQRIRHLRISAVMCPAATGQ